MTDSPDPSPLRVPVLIEQVDTVVARVVWAEKVQAGRMAACFVFCVLSRVSWKPEFHGTPDSLRLPLKCLMVVPGELESLWGLLTETDRSSKCRRQDPMAL